MVPLKGAEAAKAFREENGPGHANKQAVAKQASCRCEENLDFAEFGLAQG